MQPLNLLTRCGKASIRCTDKEQGIISEVQPILPLQPELLPFGQEELEVGCCGGCCSSRCKSICTIISIPSVAVLLYLLIEAALYFVFAQHFQSWILQYPSSMTAKIFLPPLEILESLDFGRTDRFLPARTEFGNNFAASGMIWLSSFDDVATALTSPQARTTMLGEHPLLYQNLPDVQRSRPVFLLSLSDEAAGGDGAHQAFRSAFMKTFIDTPEAKQRQGDSIAASLIDGLVKDYRELPHDKYTSEFFSGETRGLVPFIIRYLHHVIFGIDVYDDAILMTLDAFLIGAAQIGHYFYPHGYFMAQDEAIEAVANVYMASPAFQKFEEGKPEFFNMTKRELATLAVSIMRIAGVQGTYQASKIVLGAFKMQKYPGVAKRFDQKTVWDQLDLSDEEEIQQYIMECIRLDSPVSITHRVATEAFSADLQGTTYHYPVGTKIAVPIGLGNLDPDFWGQDVYNFDIKRPKLKENLLSFNSRGDQHAGRECPGKALVMATLTTMVARIGEVRRGA